MIWSAALVLLQLSASSPPEAQLLKTAREAQARFEGIRRQHAPLERWGGGGGACDRHTSVRIGRYCYWHDATDKPAVPEPRTIAAAREALLEFLDSAVELAPSDPWLVGQRTRYLIEAGRSDDAAAGARAGNGEGRGRCRAERWWCAALEGLALHVGTRYSEADSVFGVALDSMPGQERCEWFDISSSIEGRLSQELDRAACPARVALVNRLWELSRPLWSTPGNDLRTEHFARRTMAAILTRSANAHGMPWSSDSQELLLRYGWAEWFTRQREDVAGMYAWPRVTGHDREPSYQFFPLVESRRALDRLTSSSWGLADPLALTRYAPRHVKQLSALPHQLARFPRGDSMLLAIAYRAADTALARDSAVAWLLAEPTVRDPNSFPADRRDDDGSRNGAGFLAGMVQGDSVVASIEVVGKRTRRAARARYSVDALPCRGGWCLSDILLFDATRIPQVSQLDSVLPMAAAELRFSNRTPLGVFWEIQSANASPAPVRLSLTVSPLGVSLARRLATRLHLAPELAPVRLRWQATLVDRYDAQQVSLRLPPNARGRYLVHLEVEPPGAAALSARREIELLP